MERVNIVGILLFSQYLFGTFVPTDLSCNHLSFSSLHYINSVISALITWAKDFLSIDIYEERAADAYKVLVQTPAHPAHRHKYSRCIHK